MTDRLDERFARASGRETAVARSRRPLRLLGLVAVAASLGACSPLNPAAPPPGGGSGTPCTREVAVPTDTVVITAGTCDPWCVHVAAGTTVYFLNRDGALYYLEADPAEYGVVQVQGGATGWTSPLEPPGTVTFTAAQAPAVTVTIFVE